ncbi:MAG: tetratricopeptide (TPR) repeat protein [Glaciecola sp.]|jgi:tetratricopeptide (TPR) repeat protein
MNKAQKKALKDKKKKEAKRKELSAPKVVRHREPLKNYLDRSYEALAAGQPAKAEKIIRAGIKDHPHDSRLHANLISALENQDRHQDALSAARLAVKLNDRFPDNHNNLGALLKFQGNLDEARGCFEKTVELDPAHGEAWRNLVATKRFESVDDPQIAIMIEQIENPPFERKLNPSIYFALGKALEDVGEYDKAFERYHKGNAKVRASMRYDKADLERVVDTAIEFQNEEFFAAGPVPNTTDASPILIVGMPRSGSSLIEQILASHPDVHGAGETPILGRTLAVIGGGTQARVESISKQSPEALARLGELYTERLQELAPDAKRIADKFLLNFMHLGLLFRAVPNARIVHSTRDAMDNALACYKVRFTSSLHFAYDLEELGHFHGQMQRLMAHWRKFMPDSILTMPYEGLVADQEAETKRLLEFCGLEWNDAVLDFHKTDRPVRSASSTQVRKPMYNSAVGRWKKYAKHLEPLRNALGDYAPTDQQ